MPAEYWFTRVLLWTILVYIMLAVVVVMARLRHDRRRLVFARIAKMVEASGFNRASLGVIESGLADMRASMPVMRACATYLVAQIGESVLEARATRGRRWKRIAALRALAFAGLESAWPLLDRALHDRDAATRRAAIITLGHVHTRRSAELLIKALRTETYGRSNIATFLQAWPFDISEVIWPLLSDPNPIMRYWGAALAARCPSSDDLARHLIPATRDSDPSVRKAALDSLGESRCAEAVPTMIALLDDDVGFVRTHAAQALLKQKSVLSTLPSEVRAQVAELLDRLERVAPAHDPGLA